MPAVNVDDGAREASTCSCRRDGVGGAGDRHDSTRPVTPAPQRRHQELAAQGQQPRGLAAWKASVAAGRENRIRPLRRQARPQQLLETIDYEQPSGPGRPDRQTAEPILCQRFSQGRHHRGATQPRSPRCHRESSRRSRQSRRLATSTGSPTWSAGADDRRPASLCSARARSRATTEPSEPALDPAGSCPARWRRRRWPARLHQLLARQPQQLPRFETTPQKDRRIGHLRRTEQDKVRAAPQPAWAQPNNPASSEPRDSAAIAARPVEGEHQEHVNAEAPPPAAATPRRSAQRPRRPGGVTAAAAWRERSMSHVSPAL